MRDAAVPGDDEQFISGKEIPENVGVRKDGAEHQRPGDDAAAVHRMRSEHVLAAEDGLADQRPGDAMCDCVHRLSLSDTLRTRHTSGRLRADLFW